MTPGARSRHSNDYRFDRTRIAILGILLAGFVLSFFHRTAPAAIAGELTQAFAINSAVLGTLAATYFFVYTLLQIPVGVLADTLGPRVIVTGGALVAGAGSLLFGLAPTWEVAAIGRTLVGIGVSVAFIALLKTIAVWFPAHRFATLNGVAQFAGNLGAVIAGAPLAWIVTVASWRTVFVGLGVLSMALAAASWIIVRDRPEQRGFPPVHAPSCHSARHGCAHVVDACAGAGDGQSAHLAGVLRQPGHRRQLPGVRRPVGGAVPATGARHAAQRRRAARQPAAAGGRVGCAHHRGALRPPAQPARRDARVLRFSTCRRGCRGSCTGSRRRRRATRGSS